MSVWDTYPADYRAREVQSILVAIRAGECVSVVGLSGAGKSNLIGFLANRLPPKAPRPLLVDCNRLIEQSPEAFFRLIRHALGETDEVLDEVGALDAAIARLLRTTPTGLCLLLDRFDSLTPPASPARPAGGTIFSNLRALRDAHKYDLTLVTATRRPLDPHSELAELFYAHTLWLGPLAESDARWTVTRYAERKGLAWDEAVATEMIRISRGYPSFLRAVCEAVSAGAALDEREIAAHPAIQQRVEEFLADNPGETEIRNSGLSGHPFLAGKRAAGRAGPSVDDTQLTAKEHLLLEYFCLHPGEVCEKDELIRAVWPEDKIYERGIRDDSLAQLVRRLREKIEPDPSQPKFIHTVPGRGYRYLLE